MSTSNLSANSHLITLTATDGDGATGTADVTINVVSTTGTVMDIDGNTYNTIKIGNQWWMAENLKVTHYRNGDAISTVTSNSAWSGLSTGAYCSYDNNEANASTYGRLYNWYAVDDSRNIAPAGWHVPTDDEVKELEMYLGMSQKDANSLSYRGTDEGFKLKESGTNESGFTGLVGGVRFNGTFVSIEVIGGFWTSTIVGTEAYYRTLIYGGENRVWRGLAPKSYGTGVSCAKN